MHSSLDRCDGKPARRRPGHLQECFLEWRCRFQANHKHEHRVPKTHMPATLPRQITWYQTHPAKITPQDSKHQ